VAVNKSSHDGQVHYDGRRVVLRCWLRLLQLVAAHARLTTLV
jgi:hypothetical protein